jgi:hypothetical protein
VSKQNLCGKSLAKKSMDTTNEVIGVGSKLFHARSIHVLTFDYINIQCLFYISNVALNPTLAGTAMQPVAFSHVKT